MQCPYCISDINDAALVCPVCRRDLYLLRPLREQIGDLEQKLKTVNAAHQEELENRVAELEEQLSIASDPSLAMAKRTWRRSYWSGALITAVACIALLLAAHGLIVILYDLKTLYLRIASLLIPLPLGYAIYVAQPRRFWSSSVVAVAIAGLAVLGMSAVTAHVDNINVLPASQQEWREFVEYAASIAFSFFTGLLLGRWRDKKAYKPKQAGKLVVYIAKLFAKREDGAPGVLKRVGKIYDVVRATALLISASISIYTGISKVMGS